MPFQIAAELRYSVMCRSTMLLSLHALSTPNQSLYDECFTVTEGATCEFFPIQTGMNRYVRIDTGDLTEMLITYNVTAETNPNARKIHQIDRVPVGSLHADSLRYLFPSRYCQSDRLGKLAAKLFGHLSHPLAQATAISDWIFENIDYIPGSTDAATSAHDTVTERQGVCRDFAHLGIAFCRALSIPARYFTGYACNMQPPDFHACFEVCVGNQWFIFDPTRLSSPNGLIRIATGRDAADSSLATIFGSMAMESMMVSCTSDSFTPMSREELSGKAVLLEP
ncbi:transglutaminase family protein [Haloferula chungangensis]|uniref:Transglutaminase family protein n=1 Tax=Haloferula chungangensis TaxID=1048331 RepID=A0ABW2L539_9BACT